VPLFTPLSAPPAGDPPDGPALVVAVRDGRSVFVVDDRAPTGGLFLGTLDGRHCWAVDVVDDDDIDEALFKDLRMLWGALDEATWTLAGRACQLVDWQRDHRFCGRCATPTEASSTPGERAARCPRCGLLAFPRLAPAVITLIEDDDGRILLARNKNFGIPMFSLLAGFVEPGEMLEQAVARETLEEVGVVVDRIEYWGSQPWPFPHSLMIGFRARYVSGDFVLQEDEIVEANWYTADDLPMVPPNMSIAGRMIEDWAGAT
jgi:NAD+ diphosphatase